MSEKQTKVRKSSQSPGTHAGDVKSEKQTQVDKSLTPEMTKGNAPTVSVAPQSEFDGCLDMEAVSRDLAQFSQLIFLKSFCAEDSHRSKTLMCTIATLREEMAPPGTPALERLLVDRILMSWIQAHCADLHLSTYIYHDAVRCPGSEEAQKRSERADARLLAATKALAAIRKLAPHSSVPRPKLAARTTG
jgi:hypothetical protein